MLQVSARRRPEMKHPLRYLHTLLLFYAVFFLTVAAASSSRTQHHLPFGFEEGDDLDVDTFQNALEHDAMLTSRREVEEEEVLAFWENVGDKVPDTVPPSVQCDKVKRCDSKKICAIVCARGSVKVAPWLDKALALQRRLAYQRSFCEVSLPGTHNSAITLADGYGVEDHVFTGYLRYFSLFKKGMEVHTNDQLFTLTDQLQMGVRFIELDVHWFSNDLWIAHCGGFHVGLLDELIKFFNQIAKWLGTDIEWDSRTIGCNPSLSSIPPKEQRRLKDSFQEVATWLHDPKNQNEFLMVFFDDESDLYRWKKVEKLLSYIRAYFSEQEMVMPWDLVQSKGWPNFQQLIDAGKRVIFMSGSNYSTIADDTLFIKEDICNWTEPSLPFQPYPDCEFEHNHIGPVTFNTTIMRPQTSEIVYGFLNADGHPGPNRYLLDETSIPPLIQCGVSIPSPDNVTPLRMESTVWAVAKGATLEPGKCVALLRGSSTWTSVDCKRKDFAAICVDREHKPHWVVTKQVTKEHDANKACAHVSRTLQYGAPSTGYENTLAQALLKQAPNAVQGAWVNVRTLVAEVYADDKAENAVHGTGDEDLRQVTEIMAVE